MSVVSIPPDRFAQSHTNANDPDMMKLAIEIATKSAPEDKLPTFPYMQEKRDKFNREMSLPPERPKPIDRDFLVGTLEVTKEQTVSVRKGAAAGEITSGVIDIGLPQRFSSEPLENLKRSEYSPFLH